MTKNALRIVFSGVKSLPTGYRELPGILVKFVKLKNRLLMVGLAIIGLVDALYLTWIKLTNNQAVCLPGLGDCGTVNSSRYAEIFGIPVALLGAGAYLAILGVIFLEKRNSFWENSSSLIVFGICLAGTLYSLYLTYIEIWVLKAICPFCVVSAVAMLSLLILSIVRLAQVQADPNPK